MSTYVRQNHVVTVTRNYNCGSSVKVNRYAHVDMESYDNGSVSRVAVTAEMMTTCFDPTTSCDKMEREMIEAIKNCLRPASAPAALYDRLRECMDCLCD